MHFIGCMQKMAPSWDRLFVLDSAATAATLSTGRVHWLQSAEKSSREMFQPRQHPDPWKLLLAALLLAMLNSAYLIWQNFTVNGIPNTTPKVNCTRAYKTTFLPPGRISWLNKINLTQLLWKRKYPQRPNLLTCFLMLLSWSELGSAGIGRLRASVKSPPQFVILQIHKEMF